MNYYVIFIAVLIGSTAALPTNLIQRVEDVHPLILANVTYDDNLDWRVIGGSNAASGQFPYIVSLRSGSSHFCGATLVSSTYIVSAAHCTVGMSPSQITAVVGTTTLNNGGSRYTLSRIVNHPSYNSNTHVNDISLVRTSSAVTMNNLVSSIPISSSVVGSGVTVTLSGWGRTSNGGALPNNLQYINLRTLSVSECKQRLSGYTVMDSTLCTLNGSGQGACNGDSGGPLVYNNALVGAVSWGIPCGLGHPDVFTRISSFHSWIVANAK